MKGPLAPIALSSLLLSAFGPYVVESQQHVQLTTASAKFNLSLTPNEQGHTFSTYQHFQFESATSRLFHEALTNYVGGEDSGSAKSRVVVTSVHVERMKTTNVDDTDEADSGAALSLESVVSATFSDVGLYQAVKVGLNDDTSSEPNLAAILTGTVSSSDVMKALIANELVAEDAKATEFSFTEFEGAIDERGVYATETDIVSKSVNDGWPMFFAGVMMTLLVVSIVSVAHWIRNKNKSISSSHASTIAEKNNADDARGCKSVHYVGDVDLEVATTASGVLGLKGHHPQAENDENAHPNRMMSYRGKRRGLQSSSGQTSSTSSEYLSPGSPRTQKSASSKHPLGITSMRKLESFKTPPKPKSDRLALYDVERLTRT